MYFSLDKKLKEFELEHSIFVRWSPLDKEYVETEQMLAETKQKQLLLGMWKAAKRRTFLLKLKSKYAGMCKVDHTLNGHLLWYDF